MAASRRYSPKALAAICEAYEIVAVEDYKRSWGMVTRVRLGNGADICFLERMSKAEAVEQAIRQIEAHGMDDILERYQASEARRANRDRDTRKDQP